MIQCLAFGDGAVDYFDEGTLELATCGAAAASNELRRPGWHEGPDAPGEVLDYAWFFDGVASPDTSPAAPRAARLEGQPGENERLSCRV